MQRGDFPPNVYLVARRPPPVAVPGGYQDAAGIESTVTVIGVKSVVPLATWKLVCLLGVAFAGVATGWVATRADVPLVWFAIIVSGALSFYAIWASSHHSARIEVDWRNLDVRAGRWPWRRKFEIALSNVQAFVTSTDGSRFRVLAEQTGAPARTLCRGIEHRESADFIARTLEALRLRSAAALSEVSKGAPSAEP